MNPATVILVLVAGVLAVLSGWLLPVVFKSRRPYGLWGDLLASTIPTAVLAYVEWVWILPALGFKPGWLSIAAAIGDPLVLGWICLWILRKLKS
jgi:hypothetical protein